MKEIFVTNCAECPMLNICADNGLSCILNTEIRNNHFYIKEKSVPNKCPLKKEPYMVTLKIIPDRGDYDKRKIDKMVFLKDYTIGGVLFLRGDEYPVYNYNYDRMISLIADKTIEHNPYYTGEQGYERGDC